MLKPTIISIVIATALSIFLSYLIMFFDNIERFDDKIVKQNKEYIWVKQYYPRIRFENIKSYKLIAIEKTKKYKQKKVAYEGIIVDAEHGKDMLKLIDKNNKIVVVYDMPCSMIDECIDNINHKVKIIKQYYPREKYLCVID